MDLIKRTIDLALRNVEDGGRPFACGIVRGGEIVAESPNLVVQINDPTAHAEVVAIREAGAKLGTPDLEGCEIKDDKKYFELESFYDEFSKPWQERRLPMDHQPDEEGLKVYERWRQLNS